MPVVRARLLCADADEAASGGAARQQAWIGDTGHAGRLMFLRDRERRGGVSAADPGNNGQERRWPTLFGDLCAVVRAVCYIVLLLDRRDKIDVTARGVPQPARSPPAPRKTRPHPTGAEHGLSNGDAPAPPAVSNA